MTAVNIIGYIYLVKANFETRKLLHYFVVLIQNQFNKMIKKIVRSDNKSEFIFLKFGIIHQNFCVETPHKNYIVEHKHIHILNIIRNIERV